MSSKFEREEIKSMRPKTQEEMAAWIRERFGERPTQRTAQDLYASIRALRAQLTDEEKLLQKLQDWTEGESNAWELWKLTRPEDEK